MANNADVAALKQERSDLISLIRQWTTAQLASGVGPSDFAVNVEGESYPFDDWRKKKLDELKTLTELINMLSSPWMFRTRGAP